MRFKMQSNPVFLDSECYSNYYLIIFKWLDGKEEHFVRDEHNVLDAVKISKILNNNLTVGFNSRFYDIPLLLYALRENADNTNIKTMSNSLIPDKKLEKAGLVPSNYDVIKANNLWCPFEYDHIDIMKVATGTVGLKMYGARIGTANLQDMPYEHTKVLDKSEKEEVRKYCINDIIITRDLYFELQEAINFRIEIGEKYNFDCRSFADAKVAESLLVSQLPPFKPLLNNFDFKYEPPQYIGFKTQELNDLLYKFMDYEFKGKRGDKFIEDEYLEPVDVGGVKYQCGIGGLHSMEANRTIIGGDDGYIVDVDVVSYYPTIILNNRYCPESCDEDSFMEVYNSVYEDRAEAKRVGDEFKSKTTKLMLNIPFGKFGDEHSKLYSPKALIHTTVTGQLSTLMLIEDLVEKGFEVVSANTDGITVKVKNDKYKLFRDIVGRWEKLCNFKTEEVKYKSLHNQSVNSYIAVKENGGVKFKGLFNSSDLSRNPAIKICKDAVLAYIVEGKRIEDTIQNCELDPSNFLIVRTVRDGGYWKGNYLGKVVRWYWSLEGEPIVNPKGHKVAKTEHAYPIMNLNNSLKNIHYEKYIKTTIKLLKDLGVEYE
jgi:DNA polymerase elongation subunit (family B)